MTSKTHNTQAGPGQMGGGGTREQQTQQQTGDTRPERGGSRDRENRKGGSNEKNL
jgi:hypothetical protein